MKWTSVHLEILQWTSYRSCVKPLTLLLCICACLQHKDAAKLDKVGVVEGLARALHTSSNDGLDTKCALGRT